MKAILTALLFAALVCLAGCRRPDPPPAIDMAAMRAAMQEHTETLLLIHFKLDNALKEVSAAEAQAEEGGCATVGYHAADAYRELQAADEQLLELGRELQELVNLDAASANRN
ncbi:hypothetical protein ACFL33_00730 [Pseudomonadota bacterium]